MVQLRFKKSGTAAMVTLAALMLFMCSGVAAYGQSSGESAQVSQLLRNARSSAAQLRRDSVQMESYARSSLSWQSHSSQINSIKEHVNQSGKVLDELHDARGNAEPWQQDAIDGITPLLKEIASNTTAIIDHLNENKQTWHPEYTAYIHSNAELATDLHKLIGDYIEYGSAKSRLESQGKKIGWSNQ